MISQSIPFRKPPKVGVLEEDMSTHDTEFIQCAGLPQLHCILTLWLNISSPILYTCLPIPEISYCGWVMCCFTLSSTFLSQFLHIQHFTHARHIDVIFRSRKNLEWKLCWCDSRQEDANTSSEGCPQMTAWLIHPNEWQFDHALTASLFYHHFRSLLPSVIPRTPIWLGHKQAVGSTSRSDNKSCFNLPVDCCLPST